MCTNFFFNLTMYNVFLTLRFRKDWRTNIMLPGVFIESKRKWCHQICTLQETWFCTNSGSNSLCETLCSVRPSVSYNLLHKVWNAITKNDLIEHVKMSPQLRYVLKIANFSKLHIRKCSFQYILSIISFAFSGIQKLSMNEYFRLNF